MSLKNMDALDFLKELRSNSVDLVLTDPPYAISRKTNFASGDETGRDVDRFRVSYEFGEWDTVDEEYFLAVFKEAHRTMKNGATLICFYDLWKIESLKTILESCGFRMFRLIEWVKTNPVPINSKVSYLSNAREVAIVCVKGSKPTFHSEYHKGLFHYPIYQGKDRFHTTQKSLQLFEELCILHSNEGDMVVDMFSGSATTLVAAKNTNRLYAGCEKSTDYFKKAKERLGEQ
jgi:DNA modification methylase